MKMTSFLALTALMILAAVGSAYAADGQRCYTQPNCSQICPSCQAPAWDRTPVCEVVVPSSDTCPAGAPRVAAVDPWTKCGAFCSASQLAPGWPYGWCSDYWLRPDSNF